jgi:hypothetical protein
MQFDYVLVLLIFIALFYLLGKSRAKIYQTSAKQETIDFLINFVIFIALLILFFAILFLPITAIYTFFFDACAIAYNKPPDWDISIQTNVLAILICFAVSWFLAKKSEKMETINGMGTKLLGKDESSKGYIATKWLIVLFLPLIPIKSYEILDEQGSLHERTYYSMHPLPTLAKNQIKETYRKSLLWYVLMTLAIIGFALLGTWKCF